MKTSRHFPHRPSNRRVGGWRCVHCHRCVRPWSRGRRSLAGGRRSFARQLGQRRGRPFAQQLVRPQPQRRPQPQPSHSDGHGISISYGSSIPSGSAAGADNLKDWAPVGRLRSAGHGASGVTYRPPRTSAPTATAVRGSPTRTIPVIKNGSKRALIFRLKVMTPRATMPKCNGRHDEGNRHD